MGVFRLGSRLQALLADPASPSSISARARRRRMAKIEALVNASGMQAQVLDVGGTPEFWASSDLPESTSVTILNLPSGDSEHPGQDERFQFVYGDGRDLSVYPSGHFDLVVSNSVIEHVGDRTARAEFASEVSRVARAYFVQTPSYWFPVEPHFLIPAFQWLPERVRVALVRRVDAGWVGRHEDRSEAIAVVRSISLLRKREMSRLFPDGQIEVERFFGLTKSYYAIRSHTGASQTT